MNESAVISVSCPECAAQMPGTAAFCPGCGRSMQPAIANEEALVGGLRENVAGAIAYLTFIPAILFLRKPPSQQNRFVRFHSFQCLLLWVAGLALAAALKLLFLILVAIPVLGPLLVTLISVVTVLAAFLLWIVLIIKAFQGEMFKVPVIGDLAEKQADGS